MFGVTITVSCKPSIGKTIVNIKEAAMSCRTRVVSEVSLRAPIVTQHLLDNLEVVSESLYAGTVTFGSFVRRLTKKTSDLSKKSLSFLFRALEVILAAVVAKLAAFRSNRKAWASLVGVVALGVLLRRSPFLRFVFVMWRIYRLARRLARATGSRPAA